MKQQLSDYIKHLSKQDRKNLSQKALKVCEEAGELAKVVLPFDNADGTIHRFVDKNRILEEVADVYLTAISIAYGLDFSDDDIEDAIVTKAKKWADIQQSEARVQGKIPYEIHITVASAPAEVFAEDCKQLEVKPIMLELQSGNKVFNDVMTSSVHIGNNRSAYDEMKRISNGLTKKGYDVVREKIETVPWHPAAPSSKSMSTEMPKNCYFETHIGVNVPNIMERKETLQEIALQHNAHMSRNAFKIHEDGSYMQMITMRKYEGTAELFEVEANELYKSITCERYDVEKRITEFSIYDTKVSHDASWLKNE